MTEVQQLKDAGFSGRILDASSPDYAASLIRMNAAAQRNPKLVTFLASNEDVSTAIRFATK
ncbi:hypothetical protein ONS96_003206 [Cadophora gregata f. sp. sojae]|nr:hypothetical protein ONS96_003206 [Cadophora gregata f. sp. sojae]